MGSAAQNRLVQKRLKLKKRSWDGVTDDQIYERDGWRCQVEECLCPDGRDINPSLRGAAGREPWRPAIHHIVRLADGGLSHAGNKLAAHDRCSSMAHADIQRAQARDASAPVPGVVQVRLIGAPDDIDAAMAALSAAGDWKIATREVAPRSAGQEKVIGLLAARVSEEFAADIEPA